MKNSFRIFLIFALIVQSMNFSPIIFAESTMDSVQGDVEMASTESSVANSIVESEPEEEKLLDAVPEEEPETEIIERQDTLDRAEEYALPLLVAPKEASFLLGTNIDEINLKDFIKAVRYDDQVLTEDKYEVELLNSIQTSSVVTHTAKLRVYLIADPTIDAITYANVKIKWGDTIAMGGVETYVNRTTAAFSVHPGISKFITAARGNRYEQNQINKKFAGEKYYSFDWFDLSSTNALHLKSSLNGDQHMEANGDEIDDEALKKWTTQPVNNGDIVRAWIAEKKLYLLGNGQEQLTKDDTADNYYEITDQGFKQLNINQLIPVKQRIDYGLSTAELDKNVSKYLDTSEYGNMEVKRFINYPNTHVSGDTSGIIQVEETTENGKKITYDYTIPFTVMEPSIIAKGKNGTTLLGSMIDQLNWTDFVQDVQLGDEALTPDKYTVTSQNQVSLDTVGKKTANLRVALKSNPSNFIDVESIIEVKWGSTIAMGGVEFFPDRTTAAFTLHPGSSKVITASGGNTDENKVIHNHFGNEKYYSFDWFNMKRLGEIHLKPTKNGDQHIEATGDELMQDALKRWTTQPVNNGDIVRAWIAERKLYFIGNDQQQLTKEDTADNYYEVTDLGFKQLKINRLIPDKQTIVYGLSPSELDKNVSKYLDTSEYENLKVKKFVRHPNTSVIGDTSGVIQVEETTENGKKLTYDYTIPFTVEHPIIAKEKNGTTLLGSTVDQLNLTDFVQDVQLGGGALTPDKYIVTLQKPVDLDTVGKKTANLRVALKSNPSNYIDIESIIEVKWGSTIAMGGIDFFSNRTTAAFTLHPGSSKVITASGGNTDENKVIHNHFENEKYYSFDWFDMKRTSELHLELNKNGNQHIEATGDEFMQEALKRWTRQPVNNGDIVHAWTAEKKQYYTENESLKKVEADNYYEITDQGFKLLNFNKIALKKHTIDYKTSLSELDKNIRKYLDTEQYDSLEVKKFIEYPDTSKQGDAKGIIQVEETTDHGKKLTYDYTVHFLVDSPKAATADAVTQIIDMNGSLPDAMKVLTNIQYDGDKSELTAKYSKNPDTSVMGPATAVAELSTPEGKKTSITIPVFIKDENTVVKDDYAIQAAGFTMFVGEIKKAESSSTLNEIIMDKSLAKAWNIHTGSVETKNLKISKNDILANPGTYKVAFTIGKTVKEIEVNVLLDSELVDITVPTQTEFIGLDVDKGKVKSPKYKITNNSSVELGVAIKEIKVRSNSSQMKLLKEPDPDPIEKENSAKLALSHSKESKDITLDMIDSAPNKTVFSLPPSEQGTFDIAGKYFGDFSTSKQLKFDFVYSFDILF
ncbi:hypothetical protein [Enterococcus malodoratus]|uniref:WxL domain-containing protein n=1 Tax=Enterococcus malodoratus ATCC 43197 TaxID=1158601 RepID=R2P0F0_9ENTE|nr:hypothetical protein [Enterococcus malodoratus]EOH76743.1 hypothetical protein UAI_02418 [Enterococcus malodoratus ATCC 43197]EOT63556.1 hypothetical protein I585_04386 [Enterococcus malodoratus ATCC 43197]SPW69293.1 wall-associated protein [Enterococcus malodoratus]STD65877.1 wall-associated protein [Enterococcus malodoratus]